MLACVEMKIIGKPYVENYKYGLMRENRPSVNGNLQAGTKLETVGGKSGLRSCNPTTKVVGNGGSRVRLA